MSNAPTRSTMKRSTAFLATLALTLAVPAALAPMALAAAVPTNEPETLVPTVLVPTVLVPTVLVPTVLAPTALAPSALDRHAAVVAAVITSQISPSIMPEDQKRASALLKSLFDQRKASRGDVVGRSMLPLNRREAVMRGLETNLSLTIGRREPDRVQTLVREARAVFDPVLDLSLGYNRKDSYRRQKIGTVKPKTFAGTGGNEFTPAFDPITHVPSMRRTNLCKFAPCAESPKAQIRALEMYSTLSVPPGPKTVDEPIIANPGRDSLNKGHPLVQENVSIGLTQELPWGGSLTLTDNTIRQKIFYEANHYWEDGQFTSNLTAALTMPLPYTKGNGMYNPAKVNVRNAEINRERADWTLKDVVNQTLRDINLAYFETVRALEGLSATVDSQRLVVSLKERQDRILKQFPGMVTRYQEAQIDSEVTRADIQVEAALQTYLTASVALGQLIGDPDAKTGSTIYLPYSYADELKKPLVVTLDAALDAARANRPDFFIVKLDRASAELGRDFAQNQARPDIKVGINTKLGENGSVYGYADPILSQARLAKPDTITQNYSLTYTYPLGNRAADAAVEIAQLSLEDRIIVIRDTDARVKRQITSDLAAVQSARAQLNHSTAEAKSMRAAYDSLERQLGAGLVGEDQIIQATRSLLSAELSRLGASVDSREAETILLYDQGTIASAMPGQTAQSSLDRRRLDLLADAGHLKYFGPETKPSPNRDQQ
ncbi:MAG: TolC family protein [Rhodospirillaceae bacterium]